MASDEQLDASSRDLLRTVRELSEMEERKRREPRSSDAFHRLANEAEEKALEVWDMARHERALGEEPSAVAEEREEREPGDWTR